MAKKSDSTSRNAKAKVMIKSSFKQPFMEKMPFQEKPKRLVKNPRIDRNYA